MARGPDIDGGSPEAVGARIEALGSDAWTLFPKQLTVKGPVYLFDSAAPGAARIEDIDADDGAIQGALKRGTYHVEYAADGANDFVRLRRTSTAKRPPKTLLRLPEVPPEPLPSRTWKLGPEISRNELPKGENLRSLGVRGERVGGRILGLTTSKPSVLICIEADGTRRELHHDELLMRPSPRPDGGSFLVARRGEPALFEGASEGGPLMRVFEHERAGFNSLMIQADCALLVLGDELALVTRPPGSAIGTPFVIADRRAIFTALVKRMPDPRFAYLDGDGEGALVAVRNGRIRMVEGFNTTKRQLRVVGDRVFLGITGRTGYSDWREMLDFDAAWDELG